MKEVHKYNDAIKVGTDDSNLGCTSERVSSEKEKTACARMHFSRCIRRRNVDT